MSALGDIQREIDRTIGICERANGGPLPPAAKRFAKAERMEIMLGESAAQSILAETGDGVLPETIDDVPIKRVLDFPGFELVLK